MSRTEKTESKNRKVRRAALKVIMICLAAIVVISGWKVFTIVKGYMADRSVYDKISDLAEDDSGIDFDELRKINPDVIGWLRYEDTVIDYPVVQGEDNETYLSMLFDRTWGGCGTLFADCITEAPFKQFNTIVYGHHMKDGTMFACFNNFRDPDYCKKYPKFELFTPDGDYDLEIWAFLHEPSDSDIYTTNFYEYECKQMYLELVRDLATYTTDVNVSADDRLVLLSTCAFEFEEARYIVVCKMVPKS